MAIRHCQCGFENHISTELVSGIMRVDEVCKGGVHSETNHRACMEVPLDVRGGDFTERNCLKDEKENNKSGSSGKAAKESLLGVDDEVQQILCRVTLKTDDGGFQRRSVNHSLGKLGHDKMLKRGGCVPVNELYVFRSCEIHQL